MTAQPQPPATLDASGIAARIPHQGRMALLQSLLAWSSEHIVCTATSHQDTANPLLLGGVLWSACAVEYASQAMALHGVLCAGLEPAAAATNSGPRAGFLARVRAVQLQVLRLDTVPGALQVKAVRLAGDTRLASYRFELHSAAGAPLVTGRASVILDAAPSHSSITSHP